MYDNAPKWLRQQLSVDNKQSLEFTNNSFVKASSANANAGVSQALSLLVFDEAAVLEERLASEIWAAASPTLSTGGDCIMLSTPRGAGNTFHKLWTQAEEGNNKFNTIKLPWTVHPERDESWRQEQTKTLGEQKAKRQCDCNFQSSGDNVISGQILTQIQKQSICEPIDKLASSNLWIWSYPEVDKEYIISCDVARGDGSDFSAFHIIDIENSEQVGQYKAQLGTQEYGQLIVRTAKMYNHAFVVVENASIGWAVLQAIVNLEYKNVYYHKKDYKYIDPELHTKQRFNKKQQAQKDIIGFTTSSKTRPLIIQKLVQIIENRQFIIHSKRTLNQWWTFIWLNGKQQAMRTYNDDLILSMAIGVWVRYTSYVVRKQAKRKSRNRLANIGSGLHNKHQQQQKINSGFFNSGNNYKQDNTIVNVGEQQIDLRKFYFGE